MRSWSTWMNQFDFDKVNRLFETEQYKKGKSAEYEMRTPLRTGSGSLSYQQGLYADSARTPIRTRFGHADGPMALGDWARFEVAVPWLDELMRAPIMRSFSDDDFKAEYEARIPGLVTTEMTTCHDDADCCALMMCREKPARTRCSKSNA